MGNKPIPCDNPDCNMRYHLSGKEHAKHVAFCKVNKDVSKPIEETISRLEQRVVGPLAGDTNKARWAVASKNINTGWFHNAGETSYPNPYHSSFPKDSLVVDEGLSQTEQIDDIIYRILERGLNIDRMIIRLFISTNKHKRDDVQHLALPVLVHDLIMFFIRPTHYIKTLNAYLNDTMKYQPLQDEAAANLLKKLAKRELRVCAQTKKPGDMDIYDDQLRDVLEQKAAEIFDASLVDVREFIMSCKPRGDVSVPKEDTAFGLGSPVGAMLLFSYWVHSGRYDFGKPLGNISSNITRAWRKSLEYRQGGERYRALVEVGVQCLMDLDDEDEEAADLILANDAKDPEVAKRQAELRLQLHRNAGFAPHHNVKDAIRHVKKSMDTKARIQERGNTKIGGRWKDEELQRTFVRACIRVKAKWPDVNQASMPKWEVERIVQMTRIGDHFGVSAIQSASTTHKTNIIRWFEEFETPGKNEDTLEADLAYLNDNDVSPDFIEAEVDDDEDVGAEGQDA